MSNLKIEDEHHVCRYCKPSSMGEDGLPLTSAFTLRTNEEYLSVNWLEYYKNGSTTIFVGTGLNLRRRRG